MYLLFVGKPSRCVYIHVVDIKNCIQLFTTSIVGEENQFIPNIPTAGIQI